MADTSLICIQKGLCTSLHVAKPLPMLTYNFKSLLEIPLVCHGMCIGIYKLTEQVKLFKMADTSLNCAQAFAYVDLKLQKQARNPPSVSLNMYRNL